MKQVAAKSLIRSGILFLVLFCAGCATSPPKTDFVTMRFSMHEGAYFKQQYIFPDRNFAKFRSVKVERVSLDHLRITDSYNPAQAREVRDLFQGHLESEISKSFLLINRESAADNDTLIIQPAITQLGVPAEKLEQETNDTQFFSPNADGVAFEAKLFDNETGHLVGEIGEKYVINPRKRIESMDSALLRWAVKLHAMLSDYKTAAVKTGIVEAPMDNPGNNLLVQDMAAIQRIQENWWHDVLAGEPMSVLEYCTDDVVWMPPGTPDLMGKDSIANWIAGEKSETLSILVTDHEITGSGSVAHMTNHYSIVTLPTDTPTAVTERGTMIWVFHKYLSEGWKVVKLMWNSSGEGGHENPNVSFDRPDNFKLPELKF